jgi:DNA polymerase III subunit alpha
MPVYLDLPDVEPIDPQRKSYMFAIVTISEASEEYKSWTLDRLDVDAEQCIFISLKEHEHAWDILIEELQLCYPQLVIFSHCDEIPEFSEDQIKNYIEIDDEIDDETLSIVEKYALEDFAHLHLHDEYSLRDGLSTAKQRADLMMDRGWTYLTATNHGSLGGWVKQYVLAKKLGMKAIFGIEAYVNKYRNLPRESYKEMDVDMKKKYRRNNHQILLAKNLEGYYNIIKIQNDAELNGFYYVPRTDPDYMSKHGKGIIATSTDGGAGEIPTILNDETIPWDERLEQAKERYDFYKEAFDEYYIELNLIEWDEQIEINRKLITFGEWVGAEYVLTTDVHYLRKQDSEVHDVLLMLRDSKTMVDKAMSLSFKHMKPLLEEAGYSTVPKSDEWKEENEQEGKMKIIKESLLQGRKFLEEKDYKSCLAVFDQNADRISQGDGELDKSLKEDAVWEFEGKDFYFKKLDEFYQSWVDMHGPEDDTFTEEIFWKAIRGTRKVARSVENFDIDTSIKLPKMSDDSNTALESASRKGMDALGLSGKEEYEERLQHELSVIKNLDFADYFLIFHKIVEYCKEKNIMAGPGRGSAAGSIIAYCLEITKLDPIKYNLLFERFLDESRSDPPDIDWDVDPRYRQTVKEAMGELFGEKFVCSVGSYQLIWTKTAIKDVGRVFCLDPGFLNGLTKGLNDKYKDANDPDSEGDTLDKLEWESLLKKESTIAGLIDMHPYMSAPCKLLRGQIRNIGKHPAGMIVSSVDLTESIPLRVMKSKNALGEQEEEIVACWTEGLALKELQEIGLVKYDILGLRTISIISDALDLIEETTTVIHLEDDRSIRLKSTDIVEVDWEGELFETMVSDLEIGHTIVGIPEDSLEM